MKVAKIVLNGLILLEGTTSGYAPCQGSTPIATLVFPGVKIYDYSASIQYAGIFTNPDNEVFVLADLKISGADAKKAKAMAIIVPEDADANAVADAIASGDLEAAEVEDGRLQLPMPEDASGKMQIVVAIIADGEVGNIVTAPFEYYAGASPWVSLGEGYFVDDFVLPLFSSQPLTCPVEIQENTNEPGLYRLVKAYEYIGTETGKGGGTVDIEVNATNPAAVYVLTQSTGLDFGYGVMSIATVGGDDIEYFGEQGYSADEVIASYPEDFGKEENGVITFPSIEDEGSSGPFIYQGYIYDDDGGYYAGKNGAFQIVLPSASAKVKAKAKAMALASEFSLRLHGKSAVKAVKKHKAYNMPVKDFQKRLR